MFAAPQVFQNNFPETPGITINETLMTVSGVSAKFYQEYFSRGDGTIVSPYTGITLAHTPTYLTVLFRNGTAQEQGSAFTITGAQITLVNAALVDDLFCIHYVGGV